MASNRANLAIKNGLASIAHLFFGADASEWLRIPSMVVKRRRKAARMKHHTNTDVREFFYRY